MGRGGLLEKDVQKSILEYLKYRGHFAFRVNTQGVPLHDGKGGFKGFRKAPQKGVSDILGLVGSQFGKRPSGVMRGMFFAVEVKRHPKKPTPEQSDFLADVRRTGGIAVVAYSLDDVINAGL